MENYKSGPSDYLETAGVTAPGGLTVGRVPNQMWRHDLQFPIFNSSKARTGKTPFKIKHCRKGYDSMSDALQNKLLFMVLPKDGRG